MAFSVFREMTAVLQRDFLRRYFLVKPGGQSAAKHRVTDKEALAFFTTQFLQGFCLPGLFNTFGDGRHANLLGELNNQRGNAATFFALLQRGNKRAIDF